MPELPEVETVVRGLNRSIKGRTITDLWTDWPKYFKKPRGEAAFKKCVVGKKIKGVRRRGKNVLINLSGDHLLLIHQKMSGHLVYGKWQEREKTKELPGKLGKEWEGHEWIPDPPRGPLTDPMNRFIRLIFFLDNKRMLALCDLRRFAKVLCGTKDDIVKTRDLNELGPEPMEMSWSQFRKLFGGKRGRIKQVLMDQTFIVGIGNIYSDEILYLARIHPLSRVEKLREAQLKSLYRAMKRVLQRAIRARGTSTYDFRDSTGKRGRYGEMRYIYQKKKCPKGHPVKKSKVGGRTAHFCPKEQKLSR